MARSPLAQLAVLTDSTLSSTAATSESRTGLPPGAVATIRLANAAALLIWGLAWMMSDWRGPSSVPTGELALALRSAFAISSTVRLRAASASGFTYTLTANFFCPLMFTCATPGSVESVGEMRSAAKVFRSDRGIEGDVHVREMIDASAGLTFR